MNRTHFSIPLRIGTTVPAILALLSGCAGLTRPAPTVTTPPAAKPAAPAKPAKPAKSAVSAAPVAPPAPPAQAVPAAPDAPAAPPKPATPAISAAPARPPSTQGGGYYLDDGPGDNPPPNLGAIPDATPKLEPLHRFANRPYVILGQAYTPDTELSPYREIGTASWYGRRYHGNRTSSGEPYDMYAMTAAHRTLPIPSYARITDAINNKSVVVRINDRGPFHNDRLIDVSYTAAYKLGILQNGSRQVQVEAINPGAPGAAAASAPKRLAAPPPENTAQAVPPSPENGGIFVQLGAFSTPENAEHFRTKLGIDQAQLASRLQVTPQGGLFKVRAGPYPNAAEANQAIAEFRKTLNINAMVVPRQ